MLAVCAALPSLKSLRARNIGHETYHRSSNLTAIALSQLTTVEIDSNQNHFTSGRPLATHRLRSHRDCIMNVLEILATYMVIFSMDQCVTFPPP